MFDFATASSLCLRSMHKIRASRRDFLLTTTLIGAAASLGPMAFWRAKKNPNTLRIGVSDWLPASLLAMIERHYLIPTAAVLGRKLEIVRLPNHQVLRADAGAKIDAYVTSPVLHGWLPREHFFFGSLPFGMDRGAKIDWLQSADSTTTQSAYFSRWELVPQAIGVGSDHFGIFSRKEIKTAADLRGMSIASSDARADWFAAHGMQPLEIKPAAQFGALVVGSIDASEPMPANVNLELGRRLNGAGETSLRYYHFPKIRTAPALFSLWSARQHASLSQNEKRRLEGVSRAALVAISDEWNDQQADCVRRIAAAHLYEELPAALISGFRVQALEHRKRLAADSTIAALVADRFERAASPNLRG